MSKRDAVLIVGGGALQVPLVREAQALGLLPLVTDRNPHAPAFKLSGVQPFVLDTYDVAGHEELTRDLLRIYAIRGVCTAGSDTAPTVAAAAAVAGTPAIPLQVAQSTHNKLYVRNYLGENLDEYQPSWWVTGSFLAPHLPYPVVVKPLTQRGSRGVSFVQNYHAFETAIKVAQSYGPQYLIEQCLTGTEHSVEGLFGNDGELLWFNIVDRFFDYSSGVPIETGHVNPSALAPLDCGALKIMFAEVAYALGITWGPFKIDALLTPEGHPKVLECTARLSGGWDCQGTSPMTARNPMRALLQLACDLPVDAPLTWKPLQGYAACAAILPQQTGLVRALPQWWAQSVMGYPQKVIWAIQPGETLAPATHNGNRAGFCLAWGTTHGEAWSRAHQAADALAESIEVAPC
mgnify:CR=1 FL=1